MPSADRKDNDEDRPCPKKPKKPKKSLRDADGKKAEETRACMETWARELKDKAMNKEHLINMAAAICKLGLDEETVVEMDEYELKELIDELRDKQDGKLFTDLDEIPDLLWEYQDYELTATGRLIAVTRAKDGRRLIEFTVTVEQEDNHGSVIDIEAFEQAIRDTPDYNGYMWLPVLMDSHTNRPIGRIIEHEFSVKEDREGKPRPSLWARAEIRKGMLIADQRWKEIQELSSQDGGFKQLGTSIGFDIRQDAYFCESQEKCYYRISQMDWYEVSLLAPGLEPSNPGAHDVRPASARALAQVRGKRASKNKEVEVVKNDRPDPAPSGEEAREADEAPEWARELSEKLDKLLSTKAEPQEGDKPEPEGDEEASSDEETSDEEPAGRENEKSIAKAVEQAVKKAVPVAVEAELRKLGITRSRSDAQPHAVDEMYPADPDEAGQTRATKRPSFAKQVEDGISAIDL